MSEEQTIPSKGDRCPLTRASRLVCSNAGLALILCFLGLVTVSGSLTAPFIHLDDTIYVTDNPLLKSDQPWSKLVTEHVYYQRIPVTMVSYRLNAAIFGLDAAWSFRLVNWLFHVASAALLLQVLLRFGFSRWAAVLVSAVWVVHPMACESVAWVSQRRNVLGFFFGMLALFTYVRWHGRVAGFVAAPMAFALALFSSPLALGWLPIFVVLELLGGPDGMAQPEGRWRFRIPTRASLAVVPLIVLSAAVIWTGISGYARTLRPPPGGSVFTALLTDTDLFLRYIAHALIPTRLSIMYGVNAIESLADVRLWANLALWVLLIAGTVWVSRSRPRALFGWLWFFGGLGPASNIVAIGYPMQDRYLYLPLVGLLIVIAEAITGLAAPRASHPSPRSAGRWVLLGLAAIYLCFLGFTTVYRSATWSDSLKLTEDAVTAQPDAALSHIFYARQLGRVAKELRFAGKRVEAREVNRLAAQHLDEGLAKPDAYIFNPMYANVLLAGNLVDAGQHRRAIDLLEGKLPAHDAPKIEFSNGPPCYTFVASRYNFTYTLSRETVAAGYRSLARACLREFVLQPQSNESARQILKKARVSSFIALKIVSHSPESQCLCACVLMAEDALKREGVPGERAVADARRRARLSEPELRLLSHLPAVREDLKKQEVSLARLRALGCIGMARSEFEPLLAGRFTAEETRRRFDSAVKWAQQAGQLDPKLGESFLYQARIQHFLYEGAREHGNQALMEKMRQACIAALQKVPVSSACYPRAQKNLKALGAGPAETDPFTFE